MSSARLSLPRVVFVNRVYWPDEEATAQLLFDLSVELVRRGHPVTVITASEGPDQWLNGSGGYVQVVRVGKPARKARGILAKAVGYFDFIRHARRAIRSHCQPGDTVVLKTDPPMIGPCLGSLARRRGGVVLHWAQDLYPEVAMALSPNPVLHAALGWLRPWRNREWLRSRAVVTLGDDMGSVVHLSGMPSERIHFVPNWAPANLDFSGAVNQRSRWNVGSDQLLLCYSGNLGRAHVLSPIIKLADSLRSDPRFAVRIIGRGAQRPSLEADAERLHLANLKFHDPVSREMLGAGLAAADIHIVTLRRECLGTVWPSKFYGIMAAGRPVLFIGPRESELYRIVESHQLGYAREPTDDVEPMTRWLNTMASNPSTYENIRSNVVRFHAGLPGLVGAADTWQRLIDPALTLFPPTSPSKSSPASDAN